MLGLTAGYETFNFSSQSLDGRLAGNGWTAGAYLGWRLAAGLRFDAAFARSGLTYDGTAGTAAARFPAERWIASAGLTGRTRWSVWEFEPSARVFTLWETDKGYIDTLGTAQTQRSFMTGRASVGTKVIYPLTLTGGLKLSPYTGLYGEYYFNRDDAAAALPLEILQGLSARLTAGVMLVTASGVNMAFGGELGGLGSGSFSVWTIRGQLSVPF